ncbi:sensor histidine kinase [Paraclostridium sordellii]
MLVKYGLNIWDVINTITAYIDWIVFFTVLNILGIKKISNKKYLIRVVIITSIMGVINISNIFPNAKIILCMITGILFYKLSYKDNIYKCITINLLFWMGLVVTESISIGIVVMINNLDSIQPLLNGSIFRVQAIFISKVLLFIQLILFKYFSLSLKFKFKFKDMVLIGMPILSNLASLLLLFEYNFNQKIYSKVNIALLVLIILLMVLSSITLLIVIGKIVQDDKLKLEYELINERIKTNHKSYENVNDMHNKIKYIYHDLKNHMVCIKNYNTKEEIISYINNLELQISDFESLKNTGNNTLDIILGEKIYLCKKYNIEFEDSINISKLKFIQDTDICAIFANALDNAIEACMKISNETEKRIEVKATYIKEFAIIKFTNTKVSDIKFIDDRIQTTKDNKKIHGIGLSSIKYIVSKYNGEVIVNYSENEFILKIMIPIRN